MRTFSLLSVLLLVALLPAVALAQEPRDRVSFGGDVTVARGERVDDVVSMGGDVTVDGDVTGDVVTMGGDVTVHGTVAGDVTTMGGDLSLGDGASVGGSVSTGGGDVQVTDGGALARHVGHGARARAAAVEHAPLLVLLGVVGDVTSSLLRHALLFLFALLLLGLAPERIGAVHAVIVREPTRVGMLGLGAALAACAGIVLLALSIVGVPAAVALAVVFALAVYTGLAAIAGVVGAALPIARVHGRPVRELAAGVAVLWIASLVPVVGTLAVAVAAMVGLGAVVHTRWAKLAPPEGAPLGAGPFRTAATM